MGSHFRSFGAAGILGLGFLAACAGAAPDPGRQTYLHYCAGCHGTTGAGDGRLAPHLPAPPADLTVLSAANGGQFPTEHVLATIHGYPGKHAVSLMPEFGPLLDGPSRIWVSPEGEEIVTPVALLELAGHVESLQR